MVKKIKMNYPLVSILILNYNEKDRLKSIIKSFKKLNFKKYEILICDNNSKDGSEEFIKKNYPEIKFIKSKKNIGTAVYNLAIPCCKGEYILFIGNDMELDTNCLNELLKAFKKNKKVALCGPRLLYFNKKPTTGGCYFSRSFYGADLLSDQLGNKTKEVPYFGTGLIKKRIIKEIGYLYDPDYFLYNEDMDLGLRIRLAGYRTMFVSKAIAYHAPPSTTMKVWKMPYLVFLLERNALMTFFKVCSLKNLILFTPYVFGMRLVVLIKDVLTFQFKNIPARIKAILWVIFHPRVIYKKRKEIQKLRKAPDSYVFKIANEKEFLKKLTKDIKRGRHVY